jgi:hypothetical protein
MITGNAGAEFFSSRKVSSPSSPGIVTSSSTRSGSTPDRTAATISRPLE